MKTKTKRISSLTLGISFILSSITGIVLFFVPKGKNAYWFDWRFLDLTKQQWVALHITLSILLLIVGVWHIVLNWQCIINYMTNQLNGISFFYKPFLFALLINMIFIFGTLSMIPPFGTVINFRTTIKQYWKQTLGEPPFGHAEERSLNYFIKRSGTNKEIIFNKLKNNGITISNADINRQKIAGDNSMSSHKIDKVTGLKWRRARGKRKKQNSQRSH